MNAYIFVVSSVYVKYGLNFDVYSVALYAVIFVINYLITQDWKTYAYWFINCSSAFWKFYPILYWYRQSPSMYIIRWNNEIHVLRTNYVTMSQAWSSLSFKYFHLIYFQSISIHSGILMHIEVWNEGNVWLVKCSFFKNTKNHIDLNYWTRNIFRVSVSVSWNN